MRCVDEISNSTSNPSSTHILLEELLTEVLLLCLHCQMIVSHYASFLSQGAASLSIN